MIQNQHTNLVLGSMQRSRVVATALNIVFSVTSSICLVKN